MPGAPHRETLSSLLATQNAIRVARDVAHSPLDVETFYCGNCEAELNWKALAEGELVAVCPGCGMANDLPVYLRPQVQPEPVTACLEYEGREITVTGRLTVAIAIVFFLAAMTVLVFVIVVHPR